VLPKFRGCGLGCTLLDWVIAEAWSPGYVEMLAHTIPVMTRALDMDERLGLRAY
jgi:hypothetical protein